MKLGFRLRKNAKNEVTKEHKPNYLGVLAIAILSFCFGIGWYIPGGIYNELQSTFSNNGVDSSNVGLSLTIYIIGMMVGAPLVAVIFYKINRKNIIIWAAINFAISNIIIAFSINWSELLFFRFTSGISHGAMAAIGTLMAASMVPKNKRGVAIAVVYSAIFAATFTLVPLFTWWSSTSVANATFVLQFWRWSFFITSIICLLSLIFVFIFVPKELHLNGKRNIKKEITSLLYWPYMLDMLFCVCVFFCIFLIYPILQEQWTSPEYGIIFKKQNLLAVLLLIYGLFSFTGNQIGGFFADGKTFPTIYFILLSLIMIIIGLILSCVFKSAIGILTFTLLIPIVAYMLLPNVYAIGLGLAKYHNRSESVDFESGVTLFMIGAGALIGTAIDGPITSSQVIEGNTTLSIYNPDNFIIIAYIVLAVLIFALAIIFPIHWYLHSINLIPNESKMFKNILNKFPVIYDKFATDEVKKYILDKKDKNPNLKIIGKRKNEI